MKRYKWLLIAVACFSLCVIPLSGCFSQLELEVLQAELDELAEDNSRLEADLGEANANLSSLQADYDELSDRYDELNEDYESLESELSQVEECQSPRDFSSLSELRDWVESNDVSEKPITDYVEDWFVRALEVQEDAIADGYVVSADYDVDEEGSIVGVWCTAIAGGRLFFWDPETDELFEEYALGTVK
jgi:predicted nuclease with TOPRIM domain